MHRHAWVSVGSSTKLLNFLQFLKIKQHNLRIGQNQNLWFLGVEMNFPDDTASLQKIIHTTWLTKSMDTDDFIFLFVIRANSQEVVTFCFLEFYMSYLVCEFKPDP